MHTTDEHVWAFASPEPGSAQLRFSPPAACRSWISAGQCWCVLGAAASAVYSSPTTPLPTDNENWIPTPILSPVARYLACCMADHPGTPRRTETQIATARCFDNDQERRCECIRRLLLWAITHGQPKRAIVSRTSPAPGRSRLALLFTGTREPIPLAGS